MSKVSSLNSTGTGSYNTEGNFNGRKFHYFSWIHLIRIKMSMHSLEIFVRFEYCMSESDEHFVPKKNSLSVVAILVRFVLILTPCICQVLSTHYQLINSSVYSCILQFFALNYSEHYRTLHHCIITSLYKYMSLSIFTRYNLS